MSPLVAAHALGASLALLLGVVNLVRRPQGDRPHRIIGRVWVVSMYWTTLSSFFIRELNPGNFSWIHGLSAFTFVTLTIGLWAAMTGRIQTHRGFMRGSYFGTVGAFIGATVVPQRAIPQLAVQHPTLLSVTTLGVSALAWVVVALSRREKRRNTTVQLDSDVLTATKVLAAARERSESQAVEDALRVYLRTSDVEAGRVARRFTSIS